MSVTNTLDGMTTQQLQELVARAQATIKAQEQAAKEAKEAEAKVLRWGPVGEVVVNETGACVRTTTHRFSVLKESQNVLHYNCGSGGDNYIGQSVAEDKWAATFSTRWFSTSSRDPINTAENRAAVMQLLATAGVWGNVGR